MPEGELEDFWESLLEKRVERLMAQLDALNRNKEEASTCCCVVMGCTSLTENELGGIKICKPHAAEVSKISLNSSSAYKKGHPRWTKLGAGAVRRLKTSRTLTPVCVCCGDDTLESKIEHAKVFLCAACIQAMDAECSNLSMDTVTDCRDSEAPDV